MQYTHPSLHYIPHCITSLTALHPSPYHSTQITLKTTNVLIECTATDLTKAEIVLQTVCAMFSEYCRQPFAVEPVEVVDARGKRKGAAEASCGKSGPVYMRKEWACIYAERVGLYICVCVWKRTGHAATRKTRIHTFPHYSASVYPSMDARTMDVSVPYVRSMAGVDLPAADMARLLTRMQLAAEADPQETTLHVWIPVTRSDVLHPCDVVEVRGALYVIVSTAVLVTLVDCHGNNCAVQCRVEAVMVVAYTSQN